MDKSRLELYTSIVPNERQKAMQQTGFHAFIHYGMNTFTGMEWGDGKAEPSLFNPSEQNTDQWCESLKAAGVKGVIITAKHHDGFCLWQTKITEYSVKNSPYKGGKGDVVGEVSASCKKYGLKFGFYLSPWDRNSEHYGTDRYNDFYIAQLTELLTWYGDIFCVWLDGACGAHMDGKSKQVYDFERIYETVYKYHPGAAISSCGPDVRWVGNEGGYARKSEWNVVPAFQCDTQRIADSSQKEDEEFKSREYDVIAEDLGSRQVLAQYDSFMWYPAEVDVSVRPGWFYHKNQDNRVRSLKNLLNIYFTSVGGNSLLLLNVPPDKRGLFHENDVQRLKEMGQAIEKCFSKPVKPISFTAPDAGSEQTAIENVLLADESRYYSPAKEAESYEITQFFDRPRLVDKVHLAEQCDFSQRIEEYEIYAVTDKGTVKVYTGTTIGFRRFALFKKPVMAKGIKLVISQCRLKPYLQQMVVFESTYPLPKPPWYKPIVERILRIGHVIYMWQEKRKNKKQA